MQAPKNLPVKAGVNGLKLIIVARIQTWDLRVAALLLCLNHSSIPLEKMLQPVQRSHIIEFATANFKLWQYSWQIMRINFFHLHVHLIQKRKFCRVQKLFSTISKTNRHRTLHRLRNVTHKNSFHCVNMRDGREKTHYKFHSICICLYFSTLGRSAGK